MNRFLYLVMFVFSSFALNLQATMFRWRPAGTFYNAWPRSMNQLRFNGLRERLGPGVCVKCTLEQPDFNLALDRPNGP